MDERTMYELLEAHDSVEQLWKVMDMLFGEACDTGYGEGIMGNLSYVADIIIWHSPLHEPDRDLDDTLLGRILAGGGMDNHKKARLILGMAG